MTMSFSLSSADLQAVTGAIKLLLSPLDHEHPDAWRGTVTCELKKLLNADAGGFLLSGAEGPLFQTDDFPQDVVETCPLQPPPLPDGTDMLDRGLELGVSKLELAYGPHVDRYYRSDYFNEYATQLSKHDTLFTMSRLDAAPDGIASLQLFHERRTGRTFGERELGILRLLFPAIRAGAEMCVQWGAHRRELVQVMETLGQAARLCDIRGRVLHETPALRKILSADPARDRILEALSIAHERLGVAAGAQDRGGALIPEVSRLEVSTDIARYAIRGCFYHAGSVGSPLLLLTLERLNSLSRSADELRTEFRLTAAETRVAFQLARGRSNAQIATDLGISPHTVRRHTERVLQKLNVRSRAEVGTKLLL